MPGESRKMKRTLPEYIPGSAWIGNTYYINFHPSGREITCTVTGEWCDGRKVWTPINGAEGQYMLSWEVIKEKQRAAFYKV